MDDSEIDALADMGELANIFASAEEDTLEEFFKNKTGMTLDEFLELVFPDVPDEE